jgi:2'-5' RNA ligase
MEKEQILTFWLLPAEPARTFFSTLIAELAARFDAPIFEPHVTLYVTSAENEEAADVLARGAANAEPYRLCISGIDYSDEFTKTVFVQFQPDPGLTELSARLRAASASKRDYQLNPHLSLIYKTMSEQSRAELARSLTLPFAEVVFDSVKAVISPAEIKSREDVEAWRVVAEKRLGR